MSKMSEISALLDEIRSCSNTLISIYDELHELIGSQEQEEEKAKTKGTRRKKTKAEEQPIPDTAEDAAEPEEPTEKTITFNDIQSLLAMKSRDGYTAEVKALIRNYGGKKLSDIGPASYPEMMKELEVIGNA